MRKYLLVAAMFAAVPAMADDPTPFLQGEALQAEVARNCSEGCVVLNPAEAAALMLQIQMMVAAREQAAFEAGFAQGSKSCRNAT